MVGLMAPYHKGRDHGHLIFLWIHLFPSSRVNLPLLLRALYSRRKRNSRRICIIDIEVLNYFVTRFLHLLKDRVFTILCNTVVHKITFGSFSYFFIFMPEVAHEQARVIS